MQILQKVLKQVSNYELGRPLSKGNNEKVIGLMKNELSPKTMAEFACFRQKTYSYLTDDNDKNKKAKDTKGCVIKNPLNVKIIKIVQKNST